MNESTFLHTSLIQNAVHNSRPHRPRRFSLDHDVLVVANATSRAIRAQPCLPREFFVPGDIRCRACAPGAVCNGSATLLTQPNYWRPNAETITFHKCPAELPNGTCLGGFEVGTCAEHHADPLCATCGPGRQGPECALCQVSPPPPPCV